MKLHGKQSGLIVSRHDWKLVCYFHIRYSHGCGYEITNCRHLMVWSLVYRWQCFEETCCHCLRGRILSLAELKTMSWYRTWLLIVLSCILNYPSSLGKHFYLKMETTDTSETLLLTCHTQRCRIPEDCNLQCICYETRVKLSAKLLLRIFWDLIVTKHEDKMLLKSQYFII
jgi:hypothetical protein